jgi:hypothetical protein
VFTNIDKIVGYLGRHVRRQGPKTVPNQCDPQAWVYDLGENSDCSIDALVSDNVADLITAFRAWPTAKASFATKDVNRGLLDLDPRGRTRIRFSLMPEAESRLLDLRTTPIRQRIAAIDDFVAAGSYTTGAGLVVDGGGSQLGEVPIPMTGTPPGDSPPGGVPACGVRQGSGPRSPWPRWRRPVPHP